MASIPGIAFIFLLIFHGFYIPFLLLQDEAWILSLDYALKFKFFAVLILMYIFLVLGIAVTKSAFKFRVSEIIKCARKPIIQDLNYPLLSLLFWGMIFCALLLALQAQTFERLQAFFLHPGETALLKELRADHAVAILQCSPVYKNTSYALFLDVRNVTLSITKSYEKHGAI